MSFIAHVDSRIESVNVGGFSPQCQKNSAQIGEDFCHLHVIKPLWKCRTYSWLLEFNNVNDKQWKNNRDVFFSSRL